jgi:hypothetical protein
MALDSDGNRRRERFFTDTEQIFCVAKLASGVDDLTVTAAVHAEELLDPRDGRPLAVDYYLGFEDNAPGAGEDITVSFELERDQADQPYPAGRFRCELSLDDELQESLPFAVDFACPQAPLFTGQVCAGFVLEGTRCPAAAFEQECACGSDGAWSCY